MTGIICRNGKDSVPNCFLLQEEKVGRTILPSQKFLILDLNVCRYCFWEQLGFFSGVGVWGCVVRSSNMYNMLQSYQKSILSYLCSFKRQSFLQCIPFGFGDLEKEQLNIQIRLLKCICTQACARLHTCKHTGQLTRQKNVCVFSFWNTKSFTENSRQIVSPTRNHGSNIPSTNYILNFPTSNITFASMHINDMS